MRLILKGGVWKNSEDEILKAAVMKYGPNQWSRVASLLPRKTPKQCKARWQEWLDPSVRKTEWTRDEEERLLHLAKLMPAQWRTIAPLVGRTPAQCIEHYEKLLDAAQGVDVKDKRDDPRRLRPGEIDPQPEVKPARPDPVDMDEDEKEMLSEARARLANTQGKKAKRKVRERMLEEAKRLAQLQKLRELKAAGVNVEARRKRRKVEGIDYANEIPFEKRAPAGFFDTTDDDVRYHESKAKETADFKTTLINKIEKERASASEVRAQTADKRKLAELSSSNLPDVLRAQAEKDPLNLVRRAPLLMPPPTVTDSELEDIARLGMQAGASGILGGSFAGGGDEMMGEGGSVVTTGLLNDYRRGGGGDDVEGTVVALAASRRGGATGPSRDAIMEEARNQASSAASFSTPLFGGENLSMEGGTGYEGAMPSSRRGGGTGVRAGHGGLGVGSTPMLGGSVVGATPLLGDRFGGGGSSSMHSVMGGGGSIATGVAGSLRGLRDAMGINKGMDMPPPSVRAGGGGPVGGGSGDDAASDIYPSDSASVGLGESASTRGGDLFSERMMLRQLASGVLAGLAGLPKPKNEYELSVPDVPEDEVMGDSSSGGYLAGSYGMAAAELRGADMGTIKEQADAAEEAERQAAAAEAEHKRELARRSSALQHTPALPRPLVIDEEAMTPSVSIALRSSDPAVRERAVAESLINEEMVKLLKRDAVQYPIAHKFFRAPKRVPLLDDFADEELGSARALVQAETARMEGAHPRPTQQEFNDACDRVAASHVYIPTTRSYVPREGASAGDLVVAYKQRFEALAGAFSREQDRLGKVEGRVRTLTQGYETRTSKLQEELASSYRAAGDATIQVACLSRLASDESAALPARLANASALLAEEVDREKALQARYSAAVREMDELRTALAR